MPKRWDVECNRSTYVCIRFWHETGGDRQPRAQRLLRGTLSQARSQEYSTSISEDKVRAFLSVGFDFGARGTRMALVRTALAGLAGRVDCEGTARPSCCERRLFLIRLNSVPTKGRSSKYPTEAALLRQILWPLFSAFCEVAVEGKCAVSRSCEVLAGALFCLRDFSPTECVFRARQAVGFSGRCVWSGSFQS